MAKNVSVTDQTYAKLREMSKEKSAKLGRFVSMAVVVEDVVNSYLKEKN